MAIPAYADTTVRIDWHVDGYDDGIDNVTSKVLGTPGLTVEYGRDTARSTAPPMIGVSDFDLLNENREFSPENGSSPYYQFIRPGRPLMAERSHGERTLYRSHKLYRSHIPYRGIGVWDLIRGHTSAFEQHVEWGHRTVSVQALQTIALLKRKIISCAYQGPGPVSSAVQAALEAAGWDSTRYRIRFADTNLDHWWCDERPAWDVLVELLASEGAGAVMYEDVDGLFQWLNRNHRTTDARSMTSQQTFHDGTGASGIPYQHLVYDPRWDDIVNRVTVTTRQRLLGGVEVVWKLGTNVTYLDGTYTIWARPQNPFRSAITPVSPTDYTTTGGSAAISMEWANGAVAKLVVVITGGTTTISDLQLRAAPFTVVGETVIEAQVTADEGEEKTLNIAAWPEIAPSYAKSIADSYLARYQDSRPIIKVTVKNWNAAAMEAILRLRISDRVTIVNAFLGLDTEAWVEKIQHTVSVGGAHEMTFWCETVTNVGSLGGLWDGGLWDSAIWGV